MEPLIYIWQYLWGWYFYLFFPHLFPHLFLQRHYLFYLCMGQIQSIYKKFFRYFISSSLHHCNTIFMTRNKQIQFRICHHFFCRIHYKLIIYIPDSHRANRASPRDLRNHKGCRSCVNGQHTRRVQLIYR